MIFYSAFIASYNNSLYFENIDVIKVADIEAKGR